MGSRSFGSKDAETLVFSNSIRKRERMWVFPQNTSKWRFTKQVNFVWMRHSSPIITCFKCTPRWINYGLVVTIFNIPLGRKLNQPVQIAFLHLRIESSFIVWIQIVTNMHEFSPIKNFTISLTFDISTHKAAHPIIGHNNRREDLELAKRLQSDKRKENQLLSDIECPLSIIRLWEKLVIMEPNIVNSTIFSPVYAELVWEMSHRHGNSAFVLKPITHEVVCLHFFVVLVIRSYNVYLFSQFNKLFWKFIYHNSQTSHWAPRTNFRSAKCNRTKSITT